MRLSLLAAAATIAIGIGATAARADVVTNGSFETLTHGLGELGDNTNATGWNTSGYNFVYGPGRADTTGAAGSDSGTVKLWGPGDGSANGLPATSPDGGNFIAMDGDYQTSAVTQLLTGLIVGQVYLVSFDYGFSQQQGYTGSTIQSITVGFGSSPTQSTGNFNLASQGFSGWMAASMAFTAQATTDLLSFLAVGNVPVPPFALLDGVSVNAATTNVPEPASFGLFLVGVGGLAVVGRRRKRG